jgi:hypothetical protein
MSRRACIKGWEVQEDARVAERVLGDEKFVKIFNIWNTGWNIL